MSSEPKRMKQVDEAMARLQETVSVLEKHFEEMLTRLCPVVSSVPTGEGKEPGDPPRVPLAQNIIMLARRVEQVKCKMAVTLEGLEL